MANLYEGAPQVLKEFLVYMESILGRSPKTVAEYHLDLRTFLRYMVALRKGRPFDALETVDISAVDISFLAGITQSEIYDYLLYISRSRPKYHNSHSTTYGNSAKTRARKMSSLRAFFKYYCDKTKQIPTNPVLNIDIPKTQKSLPKYLSLNESRKLLDSVDGIYKVRDYCILTLFLNCGLRVSELAGISLADINRDDRILRVLGKGNKERMVYLNDACMSAIRSYDDFKTSNDVRPKNTHKNAYFISRNGTRLSTMRIKELVKEHLDQAGLSAKHASAHKLRHTAATLMYQNGVDVRTIKEVLGHENLDTTAIYTHVVNDNLREAAERNPLSGEKSET
ncbi:MAG: tyrosine-type recombinase/integrase [Clostridia bacterium]|nr:tyrosine-type recombinase/integrase [Clostridia bacterium]